MDNLLRNLQILGKVPKYGRIKRSLNGVIALEDNVFYTGAKRYLNAEGRLQTLHDIKTIVADSEDKVTAIVNSRFFNTQCLEGDELWKDLNALQTLICCAMGGIENLKATYAADLTVEAELEVVLMKLQRVSIKIETAMEGSDREDGVSRVERAAEALAVCPKTV